MTKKKAAATANSPAEFERLRRKVKRQEREILALRAVYNDYDRMMAQMNEANNKAEELERKFKEKAETFYQRGEKVIWQDKEIKRLTELQELNATRRGEMFKELEAAREELAAEKANSRNALRFILKTLAE